MTIYTFACIPLVLLIVGIPLILALSVFDLVVTILAALRANEGGFYRYPLCIRFVK